MSQKDEKFLAQLQSAFQIEAEEHVQAISSGLLELEKSQDRARRKEIVASVFREVHSLKGAARAVNLSEIETICQSLEGVFSSWRRHEFDPVPELFDPLHQATDAIRRRLPSNAGQAALDALDEISVLIGKLTGLEERPSAPKDAPPKAVAQPHTTGDAPADSVPNERRIPLTGHSALSETVRISTDKLDALLRRTEELLTAKLSANQRPAELRAVLTMLEAWQNEWAKACPEVRGVRQLVEVNAREVQINRRRQQARFAAATGKMLDFLDWNHSYITAIENRLTSLLKAADHDRRAMGGMVDALLEDSKKLLMLPFSTLLGMFPKLVRDLSRDQSKEVAIEIQGGEVEIDKRILEEVKDPLIHLLRNSVDHGIEHPQERIRRNKPACGTITLAVSQVEGNKVEIVVKDDGRGIDRAEVEAAAIRHGVISENEVGKLNEKEAFELIFQQEVSTSQMITEISGRGLGLAIAKEKVEKLGGRIIIETRLHQGTSFRLLVPLTLATFRGILIQVSDQIVVVPTESVERVVRISQNEIRTIENRETIGLDGRAVSLVRLGDALEIPHSPKQDETRFVPVIVLGTGETRIGFQADAVLEEQEVLVKPLGKPLSRVRNIAGAAVLASGKAVPVINVADLMKSAMKGNGRTRDAEAPDSVTQSQPKSILVVDDSITSRMLLKNILETGGYQVKVAVDGIDALTLLKTGSFDLVVSDVEMPRMNGLDLTAKIRTDKQLADMPIVLVTAMASKEDRERGVDAGANAYIVKSSFDQSNLLDIVRKLL